MRIICKLILLTALTLSLYSIGFADDSVYREAVAKLREDIIRSREFYEWDIDDLLEDAESLLRAKGESMCRQYLDGNIGVTVSYSVSKKSHHGYGSYDIESLQEGTFKGVKINKVKNH